MLRTQQAGKHRESLDLDLLHALPQCQSGPVPIVNARLCGHDVKLALLDELEPGRITANLVAVHLLQRAGSRVEPEGEQPPGR